MRQVKNVKQWLKAEAQKEPQFKVISTNRQGIILSVERIKDSRVFSLGALYPALRHDQLQITEFKHDLVMVSFAFLNSCQNKEGAISDYEQTGLGTMPINDLIIETVGDKEYFTDALLEKSLKEMQEKGIKFQVGSKKTEAKTE